MTEPDDDSGSDERTPAERRLSRRQASAYQGATEAVFSILIAAGFGIWADYYFETSPRYLLVGLILGFVAFVTRLVRLGREMNRTADPAPEASPDAGRRPDDD